MRDRCCCSVTKSCLTLWDPINYSMPASLSFTISWSLLKLMSTESLMPPYHLLCHPLLLISIFPSIRVFSNELALCLRWPKYWSFSFSIGHSNGYSGFISFRIDWFDFLVVQGTHKSLPHSGYINNNCPLLFCSSCFHLCISIFYLETIFCSFHEYMFLFYWYSLWPWDLFLPLES